MPKVDVNLRRLNADLATKAPSWAVLEKLAEAAGKTISQDTVARIRAEGQATLKSLATLASILQTSVEDYLRTDQLDSRRTQNISGEWLAFYLETWPPLYNTSLTKERLLIRQVGSWINGTYEFLENDDPNVGRDTVFEMSGRVVGDFVTGFYFVRGRESEQGVGTFQLKLIDEARFAEGFCTYCSDTDVVSSSPNLWVRQREATSPLYLRNVRSLLDFDEFHTRPSSR